MQAIIVARRPTGRTHFFLSKEIAERGLKAAALPKYEKDFWRNAMSNPKNPGTAMLGNEPCQRTAESVEAAPT